MAVLAAMIAREIKGAPPKPKLRLVRREDIAQTPVEDSVTREARIARIRWLARCYGLQIVVQQHVFGRNGLDALEADELLDLHKKMERARECVVDGFSLDEAGIISTMDVGDFP